MGQIHLKKHLEHPAASMWEWLKDYANIHRIHPLLSNSYLVGDKSCGVGAVRICEMKMGGVHLKERVTDWKEGRSYTVDVYETSMPIIDRSIATLGVRSLRDKTSEAYMDIEYTTKYGLFGKLMDVLFLNLMMKMIMKTVLKRLERSLNGAEQSNKRISFARSA
jgi:hypothetical protein